MKESRYLSKFRALHEAGAKGALHTDRLLIEVIEDCDDEDAGLRKTTGGIYMAESNHARSDFMMLKSVMGIVLEVGKGYFDPDTGKDIPLTTPVGAVVWVPANSIGYCTTVPGIDEAIPTKLLALVNESEIRKSWASLDDYLADKAVLNDQQS